MSGAADPAYVKMAHVKQFQRIPMSKSMRGLCKEEDYAFLGTSEKTTREETEGAEALQDEQGDIKEERVHRRLQREQQEKERLRDIEESKREKEQQWRTHVTEVSSSQEKTLQDRLARLRKFREFQRKVLVEESGIEGEAVSTVNQLLTRM
ncbi:U2 small nuclear ribonucleoprotein auxiliary factor 35 kDa subunit-related protein 1-like isoform X2 [Scomber scombrus]|uniref:U2 small nuclear ribonucleoprotein auxiliary factor 35 kDa subunit-related protein 1-like isoform X2 n=1 Tax=Scomber scombrus TaxID=13677 RepID=A0AAV1NK49_SCOSC